MAYQNAVSDVTSQMHHSLALKSMRNKTETLRSTLEAMIKSMAPNTKLPSERQMAKDLGVNHRTVRRALDALVEEGLVIKRPRVGNFVGGGEEVIKLAVALPPHLSSESSNHTYVGIVLSAINEVLDNGKYSLSVLPYDPKRFLATCGYRLISRKIDGLFLFGNWQLQQEEIRHVMNNGIRLVLLSNHQNLQGLGLASFHVDSAPVAVELANGLIDRGHREILYVGYTQPTSNELVLNAFRQSCENRGVILGDDHVLYIDNADASPDYTLFREIIKRKKQPTAIVLPDEIAAAQLFRYCYEFGVNIPRDISVAAISSLKLDTLPIPLTSVDAEHLIRKQVKYAFRHLVDEISGQAEYGITIPISGAVIWRESVADLTHLKKEIPKNGRLLYS